VTVTHPRKVCVKGVVTVTMVAVMQMIKKLFHARKLSQNVARLEKVLRIVTNNFIKNFICRVGVNLPLNRSSARSKFLYEKLRSSDDQKLSCN